MNKILIAGLIVLLVTGVGVGGVKIYSAVRGIRNNNPLNIELGDDQWDGMAQVQNDGRFIIFTDALYGIRAAARIFSNYAKRGVNTLEEIISTWAPPYKIVNGKKVKENDTEAYINFVVKKTGFARDRAINKNAGDYTKLISAMISMENGVNPYSTDLIARGVSMS